MSAENSDLVWLPALGGLAVKSLLVFLIAGAALLALRRASASARHLVCLLTLAGLLALPLLSAALPGWRLAVLAEPTPRQVAAPPETGGGGVLVGGKVGVAAVSAPLRFGEGGEERAGRGSLPLPPGPGSAPRPFPWLPLLVSLWSVGALLSLLRPGLGLWGIARLSQASEPVSDAPALALAAECAAALGLARTPALRSADVPVPMTWGWRRPVVLLPEGARDWTASRLRAVLLHELAHVRRRDWLSHRMADAVCALYWFHPLVWLTARRLRAEGEIACDDLVLTAGVAAPDYARHLLDVARALRPVPPDTIPSAAVAMARTDRIEGRLLMILDDTRPRRALTRRALLIMLGLSAAALVPLAVLRPGARAAAPAASMPGAPVPPPSPAHALQVPSYGRQIIVAPGGDIPVQLVGMTSPGSSKWWDEQGKPLGPPTLRHAPAWHTTDVTNPKQRCVLLAFRLPASAQDVTVKYALTGWTSTQSDGTWLSKTQSTSQKTEAQLNARSNGARVLIATFPASVAKTDVRVGTASGPWKVVAEARRDPAGQFQSLSSQQGDTAYIFSPLAETKDGTLATISMSTTGLSAATFSPYKRTGVPSSHIWPAPAAPAPDLRVVAVDDQGHEVLPADIGDTSINTLDQINARFALPPARIATLWLESRPFRYVEFKNVAVRPVH